MTTASMPYPEPGCVADVPPIHDEQIIRTILVLIEHSDNYDFITTAWRAIGQIRRVVGRPE